MAKKRWRKRGAKRKGLQQRAGKKEVGRRGWQKRADKKEVGRSGRKGSEGNKSRGGRGGGGRNGLANVERGECGRAGVAKTNGVARVGVAEVGVLLLNRLCRLLKFELTLPAALKPKNLFFEKKGPGGLFSFTYCSIFRDLQD